jgi:2,3-dihydroxybiphenyl 1,2-dioxygenase
VTTPHQHGIELAYLGLEVSDPQALGAFLRDTVGLIPGEPAPGEPAPGEPAPGGADAWRNDGKAQRIVVGEGPTNDASYIGFEAADEDAFDKAVARLHTAGHPTTPGAPAHKDARRVTELVHTEAPWGTSIELVIGLAEADTTEPFASPLVPGGFLTEGVGLGHVVVATTAFEESHHFLTEGLGMKQSDWVETEIAAGIQLEVRFYHCNERHHSLAVARAPFDVPQTLHHVMFEANDRDDVGRAFDRAWNQDLTIANGLGRHDNDGMFSFYVVSPAGFQVEFGHGARRVTTDWDDNRRYDRISMWGHQPLHQGAGSQRSTP